MGDVNTFSIKKVSQLTGLAEDTIRYYEKIGLLPRAKRKTNNHRFYNNEDIYKMNLITCLKKTNMSLDEMRPFLQFSYADNPTNFPWLLELMTKHKEEIEEQITKLQSVVNMINMKLDQAKPGLQSCSQLQEQHK